MVLSGFLRVRLKFNKMFKKIKEKLKKFRIWIIAIVVGSTVVVTGLTTQFVGVPDVSNIPIDQRLKVPVKDVLNARQFIHQKKDNKGRVIPGMETESVKYGYKSDKKINEIDPRIFIQAQRQGLHIMTEDLEKRNKNSRTYNTDKPGIVITEFISGSPQYVKDNNNEWWQIEYATTSMDAFLQQTVLVPPNGFFSFLYPLIKFAYAADATFNLEATAGPTYAKGSTSSGDYTNTQSSDDGRLITVDSTGSPGAKWQLDLSFDGVSPSAQWEDATGVNRNGIHTITITLEARDTVSTDNYYILLWDFTTGAWTEIGAAMSITSTEA